MCPIQTKITSHGQVSVPAAIRRLLAPTPGSSLVWTQEACRVTLQRVVRRTTSDVHRALFADGESGNEPKALAELKQGIRQHIKSRHARG